MQLLKQVDDDMAKTYKNIPLTIFIDVFLVFLGGHIDGILPDDARSISDDDEGIGTIEDEGRRSLRDTERPTLDQRLYKRDCIIHFLVSMQFISA